MDHPLTFPGFPGAADDTVGDHDVRPSADEDTDFDACPAPGGLGLELPASVSKLRFLIDAATPGDVETGDVTSDGDEEGEGADMIGFLPVSAVPYPPTSRVQSTSLGSSLCSDDGDGDGGAGAIVPALTLLGTPGSPREFQLPGIAELFSQSQIPHDAARLSESRAAAVTATPKKRCLVSVHDAKHSVTMNAPLASPQTFANPNGAHLWISTSFAYMHEHTQLNTNSGILPAPSPLAAKKSGDVIGKGGFATVRLALADPDDVESTALIAKKEMETLTSGLARAAATELAFFLRADGVSFASTTTTPLTKPADHRASTRKEATPVERVWTHIVRIYAASHDPLGRRATLELELMRRGCVARLPTFVARRLRGQRRVARSCAAGLRTQHDDLRVLHRDVKPANILVAGDGSVKLADLGSAALLAEGQTEATDQAGSTVYMSPERARGEAHGPASDVWSLGVTLLQLALGGVHPFLDPKHMRQTREPFWLLAETVRFTAPAEECAAATRAAIDVALGCLERSTAAPPLGMQDQLQQQQACFADLASFVHSCLATNPNDRPTAAALLSHPFCISLHGSCLPHLQ